MNKLEGRHAVVTGAGRGIGRAIAAGLAEEGALVTLVARSR
ncbi:MAG TPA: SDR family NAD(P)-dependent oxidoreductase, partial [Terriglobales bacterium]|nr:SDR family NAD(P)-dependent oxidoreductase [Terriglobales bacterium]